LSIVLFNDEIIGLDIQKYCTDNKKKIRVKKKMILSYKHNFRIIFFKYDKILALHLLSLLNYLDF